MSNETVYYVVTSYQSRDGASGYDTAIEGEPVAMLDEAYELCATAMRGAMIDERGVKIVGEIIKAVAGVRDVADLVEHGDSVTGEYVVGADAQQAITARAMRAWAEA